MSSKRRRDILLALCIVASSLFSAWQLIFVPSYSLYSLQKPEAMMTAEEFMISASLDINSATAVEFCEFDGIGFGIAERIIEYREANGGFSSVEELMEVDGIGEKRYNTMLPYICCLPYTISR